MKIYIDNDKETINVVQSVVSASTMISSITSEVRDYLVSKFPKNYFKSVYVDTAQTVSEQLFNDRYDSRANKKPYPSLTITPEISLDDPIGGMEKGMHLSSPNLYVRKDINRTYRKVLVDPQKVYSIYYTSDYLTTNFNVKIAVNTYIQNVDLSMLLKSKFQLGMFQYLNDRYLQTEIPKTFVHVVADLNNLNMNNPDDLDKLRLLLIGTSRTDEYIQKKVNLSTGKDCFFLNEKQNFLILFTDLDCPPSIIRDNQVEGEYIISFRFQVSTYLPNAFILNINNKQLVNLKKLTIDGLRNDSMDEQESGFLTRPIVSSPTMLTKELALFFDNQSGDKEIGQLIYSDKYTKELNKSFPEIFFMDKMTNRFKKVHSYAIAKNINITSLLYFKVVSRDAVLDKSQVTIDYEKLSLKISDSTIDSDIAVGIYLNRVLFETLEKAMKSDSMEFNDNFMSILYARLPETVTNYNIPTKLLIKSFKNDREMFSQDYDKSFRINTVYGIGYLALENVPDTDDAYKICVGYDKNNKPIIKKIKNL